MILIPDCRGHQGTTQKPAGFSAACGQSTLPTCVCQQAFGRESVSDQRIDDAGKQRPGDCLCLLLPPCQGNDPINLGQVFQGKSDHLSSSSVFTGFPVLSKKRSTYLKPARNVA
jgi:hypothetical protein